MWWQAVFTVLSPRQRSCLHMDGTTLISWLGALIYLTLTVPAPAVGFGGACGKGTTSHIGCFFGLTAQILPAVRHTVSNFVPGPGFDFDKSVSAYRWACFRSLSFPIQWWQAWVCAPSTTRVSAQLPIPTPRSPQSETASPSLAPVYLAQTNLKVKQRVSTWPHHPTRLINTNRLLYFHNNRAVECHLRLYSCEDFMKVALSDYFTLFISGFTCREMSGLHSPVSHKADLRLICSLVSISIYVNTWVHFVQPGVSASFMTAQTTGPHFRSSFYRTTGVYGFIIYKWCSNSFFGSTQM